MEDTTRVADDARTLFAYLLLAGKNVLLYPDGHSISVNSIRQFYNRLEAFIRKYGHFKIQIEKDRVICREQDIYSGPFEEGALTFPLFRDGIRWLEFSPGISEEEVLELMTLLGRYKALPEEPEGDIVTALWEKRFTHIHYEAADIIFGESAEPSGGVSRFKSDFNRENIQRRLSPAADVSTVIDPADLVLTPQEQAGLQAMVLLEETADASSHLYMLLDSLLLYDDEESFGIVLDVLAEEFKNFLDSRDFQASLLILEGVHHIMDSGRPGASWAWLMMEALLIKISDANHLESLEAIWLEAPIQHLGILARILLRLHPKAASRVADLLLVQKPPHVQTIVEDALISYVQQDANCLGPLVGSADENMATRLIPVLARADADIAGKYLMQLMRHPSVSVRRLAVNTVMQGRPFPVPEIFDLIDDPDETVRRLILRCLSQERNPAAEELLLKYLQNNKFKPDQTGHVFECFKTLGKCGSLRSVPYLRETLFRRKWTTSFLKSPFRRGAAAALAGLHIPESDQVLEEARRIIHPGLRRVVRDACEGETIKRRIRG